MLSKSRAPPARLSGSTASNGSVPSSSRPATVTPACSVVLRNCRRVVVCTDRVIQSRKNFASTGFVEPRIRVYSRLFAVWPGSVRQPVLETEEKDCQAHRQQTADGHCGRGGNHAAQSEEKTEKGQSEHDEVPRAAFRALKISVHVTLLRGRNVAGNLDRMGHSKQQVFQNRRGGARLVERVKMNAGRALAQQFPALIRGVFNAVFDDRFVVIPALFQLVQQGLGQVGAAESSKLFDLGRAENGDDARDQRDTHSQLRQIIPEFEVIAVVKEKLGDHEIRALIDFVLQPSPVHVFAFFAGDVSLGKTGYADGKPARLADELDQLIGKLESSFGLLEFACGTRRITAQRQDIVYSARAGFLQVCADVLPRGIDASEMGHGREAVLPLNAIHDHQRLVPRAAASAVSDGTETRLELHQRGDGLFQQDALAFRGPGRKEFKGDDRAFGGPGIGEDVSNEMHEAMIPGIARNSI